MVPDTHRRQFLFRTSLTLGGAALGAWLPALLVEAAPAACLADTCGDWQLDDICIAYPPYSLHMKAPAPPAAAIALVDPADLHWVA
jgi:hypothetical protein